MPGIALSATCPQATRHSHTSGPVSSRVSLALMNEHTPWSNRYLTRLRPMKLHVPCVSKDVDEYRRERADTPAAAENAHASASLSHDDQQPSGGYIRNVHPKQGVQLDASAADTSPPSDDRPADSLPATVASKDRCGLSARGLKFVLQALGGVLQLQHAATSRRVGKARLVEPVVRHKSCLHAGSVTRLGSAAAGPFARALAHACTYARVPADDLSHRRSIHPVHRAANPMTWCRPSTARILSMPRLPDSTCTQATHLRALLLRVRRRRLGRGP
jgi:hypothetical protein